ncbi:MAG TPA: DHA2 family efflux MFS transporter permease subunit [Acidimicrobiales bacterium]|nr:DHA2 family efflux MFS transporter permease subunit [Acidimicrobiales bacterium]
MTELNSVSGLGASAELVTPPVDPPPDVGAARVPWATFAVCAVSSYIATLDMSIVNVAFPEIARSFPDVSRGSISWVVTAYSIMFGSLLVVSGRMADRVGRKRMLQTGLGAFAVGSVLCAMSPGLGMLVFGRAVQGVGGALMMPASLGLLLASFPESRRSQAMAWVGAAGALGVASGPTLGALLVSAFGWRSAFWVNVPVCAALVVVAARTVREPARSATPRPDAAAAVLITLAVGSLVWGISRAEEHGWRNTTVLGLLVVSATLVAGVVWRTLRHPVPLLPPSLFSDRTFRVANVATFVFGAAFAANILNNVLFLRSIWSYSVVRAGLFSVLAPVVVAITSIIAGRVMSTVGFRTLLVAGQLVFAAVAVGQATLLDVGPAPWTRWLPLMLVLGISIGFTFPVLTASAVSTLAPAHFALGGAVNNTSRQVGSAVGVALVVTMQSAAPGIDGYRAGWFLVAGCGLLAAAVSVAQPRVTPEAR